VWRDTGKIENSEIYVDRKKRKNGDRGGLEWERERDAKEKDKLKE